MLTEKEIIEELERDIRSLEGFGLYPACDLNDGSTLKAFKSCITTAKKNIDKLKEILKPNEYNNVD